MRVWGRRGLLTADADARQPEGAEPGRPEPAEPEAGEEAGEERRLSPFERGLFTKGGNDPTEIARMREGGAFWPGEFACPVLLAKFPPLEEKAVLTAAPTFLGTATLIGGDLFLSARHVFFQPDGQPIHTSTPDARPAVAVLRVSEDPDIVFLAIEWVEAHPDPHCDLVIGKLVQWDAVPPWEAVAQPEPLNDVVAVGYPYDRMAVLNTGDVNTIDTAFNSPRYLKGYVTRGVDLDHDPFMPPYSFEVSFPLTSGMSGCPLWHAKEHERALLGIASGSLTQLRPVVSETRIDPDGTRVITEVARVDDYGVAVRITAVLEWEIAQLGRRPLSEVLATAGRKQSR